MTTWRVAVGLFVGIFLSGCTGTGVQQDRPIACTTGLVPLTATQDISDEAVNRFNTAYRAYNLAAGENRVGEALEYIIQAIEIGRPILDARKLATMEHNMAKALASAGKITEAQEVFECLTGSYVAIYGEDSLELASIHLELASLARHQFDRIARWRESRFRRHARSAMDIVKKTAGEDSEAYGGYLLTLAKVLSSTGGDQSEIEQYYLEAFEANRRASGPHHPAVGLAAYELGSFYWQRARESEAAASKSEEYLRLAIDIFQSTPDRAEWLTKSRSMLMLTYAAREQREATLEQCLKLRELGAATSIEHIPREYQAVLRASPPYPRRLARSFTEGYAIVEFDLDELGKPMNLRVVEYGGSELFGEASIAAVEEWRYPPRCDGEKLITTENVQSQLNFDFR